MGGTIVRFCRGAALAALLASCGGSGGSSSAPPAPRPPVAPAPPPAPPVAGPVWRAGVYEPASTFKDRCERPRAGVDIEGNPFPDEEGSTTLENFWLRSWTRETYLWNREVPDLDPAAYDDRLAYFDTQKTDVITPSGAPKDDFHFSQPTEDFLAQRNSAPTASYGVGFAFIANTPPRDLRVRYTDPGTPAAAEGGFLRGDRILEADGADLVNGGDVDTLNAALFPARAGETHAFLVEAPDGARRQVTLVSADLSRAPVNKVRVLQRPDGKVGYLLLNSFGAFSTEAALIEAVETLEAEGVRDLILDLRYNGGGLLAIASQLGTMVAGPEGVRGRTFERLRFNADAGRLNPVTGRVNDPIPFFDTALGFSAPDGQPLPSLRLPRVFVLSTGSTCSASEAFMNGLRGVGFEVVLIGDRTCGKPFGFYPEDNCGETYYTIQFQGVNDASFGDYADGFVPVDAGAPFGVQLPGCFATDDLRGELGTEDDAMTAAALAYRETGQCPVPSAAAKRMAAAAKVAPSADGSDGGLAIGVPGGLVDTNRDMRMPEDGR
jgi:hypothetical protein